MKSANEMQRAISASGSVSVSWCDPIGHFKFALDSHQLPQRYKPQSVLTFSADRAILRLCARNAVKHMSQHRNVAIGTRAVDVP